ncbi:ATP-binding protein [Candidatus Woesearchaeota archaeon]|nr:ATP-binding protein [Candidatus Woesearchaeota archaeon]
MKIHLPNSAFLGNIDPFLRGFNPQNRSKLEITANKKWISLHPMVLSMVAALGLSLKPEQIYCEKLEAASKHYLKRMGLFKLLKIRSGIKPIHEHEPAGRFIPLTKITNSAELTNFITEMVPLLHLEPKHAAPLKYVISELVRNVLEHAQSKTGAIVSAQYYKKSNTIRIGVADAGLGIKYTINQSHPASTHLEAIRLALTPGITGTTWKEGGTELNAGAGLFFIKSIAKTNRDFLVVYSGDALYKLLKSPPTKTIKLFGDPFQDKHSHGENLPFWQGTVVGMDISLKATEEFTSLLDLIWETVIKSVKERKKARYRRARFI